MQGMDAVERYFTVAKRIALFLARTSSQHTIDHLVYEISRQISEDDDTAPAISSDLGVSKAYATVSVRNCAFELNNPCWVLDILHSSIRLLAWSCFLLSNTCSQWATIDMQHARRAAA